MRRGVVEATLPAYCDCFVEGTDIRVRTPSGKGTYPDGFVVCGKLERDAEDEDSIAKPRLTVEVLSDASTRRSDRAKSVG